MCCADSWTANHGFCEQRYRERCHTHWRITSWTSHSGHHWQGTIASSSWCLSEGVREDLFWTYANYVCIFLHQMSYHLCTLDPCTHHPRHQKSSTPCILLQQHSNFNCTCLSSLNSAVTLHIYSGESHHNWAIWVPGSFSGFMLKQVFFMSIMGKRIPQYLLNRLDTSSIYLVVPHLRTNFSRFVRWITC
jgi:hypothetical protein